MAIPKRTALRSFFVTYWPSILIGALGGVLGSLFREWLTRR